jgi:alpha-L-rhamnosidase
MYSRNHCMLGHAEEWFYTGLAGINHDPSGPGFRRIVIAPQPIGDLAWAKGSHDSVSGRIESSWTIAKQQFKFEVTIPPNTTATVWVPTKEVSSVTEGNGPAARSKGVTFLKSENGASAFEIGSGHYAFATPWNSQ